MRDADDALLARIAGAYGIVPMYRDLWGREHRTNPESQRAILDAMGVDKNAHTALHTRKLRKWPYLLPAVIVVRYGCEGPRIPLTVAEPKAGILRKWTLTLESGEVHSGELVVSTCTVQKRERIDGQPWCRCLWHLPIEVTPGYHLLSIDEATTRLIVVPQFAYQPDILTSGGRVWGIAAQLYGLRSTRNWGVGDFTDLSALISMCADAEAQLAGVNPLHALFPHNLSHTSPYSPSNRLFLNFLYLDVEAIPDFAESAAARERVASREFQSSLAALRDTGLVDYRGVGQAKLEVLALLYESFRQRHLQPGLERGVAFTQFRQRRGRALELHTCFDALAQHFFLQDQSAFGWLEWPAAYHDPSGRQVRELAVRLSGQIDFFAYLQWQAELQLAGAAQSAQDRGLGLGLYLDLALGANAGGSETWSHQGLYALRASAGAPPDDFNPRGQNWGLPPLNPSALADSGYALFIDLLRANMRHAGVLRIDHVMWMARLLWIPQGADAADAAYVRYPAHDLLGILVLESWRNRCVVIGEDLGTVPTSLRRTLKALGLLAYRPLYFEKLGSGSFKRPAVYESRAAVAVSTHDLPTLSGWWAERDIAWRDTLGLYPSPELQQRQREERSRDRAELLRALRRERLLAPDSASEDALAKSGPVAPDVAQAVHRFLARAPAKVLLVQPEDLLGELEQPNLPGSTDGHPNWRRKLSVEIEQWLDQPSTREIVRSVRREKGDAAARGWQDPQIPRATYRLQLSSEFGFDEVAALMPYLKLLGVSHAYLSPIFAARPGSAHGYDITDHASLSDELGGREGFSRLHAQANAHGIALMLDIVPNHIGVIGSRNPWWMDVLEHGEAAEHADWFDINWQPLNQSLKGKVLLPVLDAHYGEVLERGDLKLVFERQDGSFVLHYREHHLPIDPREYSQILRGGTFPSSENMPETAAHWHQLREIAENFGALPPREAAASGRGQRASAARLLKQRLAAMCAEGPPIAEHIANHVAAMNGTPGNRASFDGLDALLQSQAWRLAFWRVAADDVNYRRFFDINDLVALRVEREEVFDATHRLVRELVADGSVRALRVDHADGLADPIQYCRRLSRFVDSRSRLRPYLVVEKVAASHERLALNWPVYGTTGYRFAALVSGLFINSAARNRLHRIYRTFTGSTATYDEQLQQCKALVIRTRFAAELERVAVEAWRIALTDRHTCDFTLNRIRDGLAQIAICFPVYRTYVSPRGSSDQDLRMIAWAVQTAKKHAVASELATFDFLARLLAGESTQRSVPRQHERTVALAQRFQQFTCAVMAKGKEDTSFYRYIPLAALDEVGSDPREFGISVSAFHAANRDRMRHWPHTMLASSTHDTKRGEDSRARLAVLSEIPALWRLKLRHWRKIDLGRHTLLGANPAPTANDEYLLYQTLVSTWPYADANCAALHGYSARVVEYMRKAIREAKQRTSWINPDQAYESAVAAFVERLLDTSRPNAFLEDFDAFAKQVARWGRFNSIAQAVLKVTSPGVPDFYQGSELWNFSLVDPDNRRAVDFREREKLLTRIRSAILDPDNLAASAKRWLDHWEDGCIKLHVLHCVLNRRRELEDLWRHGRYLPLSGDGTRSAHVVAFARHQSQAWSLVFTARLFVALCPTGDWPPPPGVWGGQCIEIPADAPSVWEDIFTARRFEVDANRRLLVSDVLSILPAATLLAVRPTEERAHRL